MTATLTETNHGVEVGAIFVESWGYDQTNIDYYEVIKVTKTGVWLKPIESARTDASHVVPVPGAYKESYRSSLNSEKGFFKKVSGGWQGEPWINLTSYSGASLWKGGASYETPVGFGH